jgi:hypothetical protein
MSLAISFEDFIFNEIKFLASHLNFISQGNKNFEAKSDSIVK